MPVTADPPSLINRLTNFFSRLISDHDESTTAQNDPLPEATVPSDTPDAIAGAKELPLYSFADLRQEKAGEYEAINAVWRETPGQYRATDMWRQEAESYNRRRDESKIFIDQCRHSQTECSSSRVAAWSEFIDKLKSSNLDDKAKVEAVNIWVNEVIHYDKNKKDLGVDWHQTPFTTLSTGMGQCADIARLKYESLKELGIDDKNMRLVDGKVYGEDGKDHGAHEILIVNVKGTNFVLNNNLTDHGWTLRKGGIEPDRIYMGENSSISGGSRFVPLASENDSGGTKFYRFNIDEKGQYHLEAGNSNDKSAQKTNGQQSISEVWVDDASSIEIAASSTVKPTALRGIERLIRQAHSLNPSRQPAAVPVQPEASPEPDYTLVVPGAPVLPPKPVTRADGGSRPPRAAMPIPPVPEAHPSPEKQELPSVSSSTRQIVSAFP